MIIDLVKKKNNFYNIVIKSYLHYAKKNNNIKSKIIIKCYNETKLSKDCITKIKKLINKEKNLLYLKKKKFSL